MAPPMTAAAAAAATIRVPVEISKLSYYSLLRCDMAISRAGSSGSILGSASTIFFSQNVTDFLSLRCFGRGVCITFVFCGFSTEVVTFF